MEHRLQQLESTLVPSGYKSLQAVRPKRWRRVWQQRLIVATLVSSDVTFALLIWWLASDIQAIWGKGALTGATIISMVPVIAVWVGLRALLGLYPGYGLDSVEHLRRHTYAVAGTMAILAVFAVGFHFGGLLSRLLWGSFFLTLWLLVPFTHYFVKRVLKEAKLWGKPVVVLSYKESRIGIATLLDREWNLGYNPIAVVDYRLDMMQSPSEDVDHQQDSASVLGIAREWAADTAIFAMPHTRREQLAKLVSQASLSFKHVLVIPNLNGITNSAVVARNLAGTFAVEIKYNLLNPWALRTKRAADIVATVVGGALTLPLILVLVLLVYLESGWPIFYADKRMGKDGRLFSCLKFRTMVEDAEAVLQRMLEEDSKAREEYFKYHKLRDDPRVTRIGRFLRRTSLDELPQIWNVLRGEMSLVGPRPYLPRESKEIGVTQSEILRVPPGITGPWQVSGRNHALFSERIQMDAHYIRDWSIWLDIVLLARTAKTLLFDRRAY